MGPDASVEVQELLKEHHALLSGHFLLASGKHSDTYVQCALVLQDPAATKRLCELLAPRWGDARIQSVCGPALGGVVIGYELARALGVRGFFTERKDGVMCLRRGFQVSPGERVLVAEDVVTTGGSALEARNLLEEMGAEVVGITSLVDRGGGRSLPVAFEALLRIAPPTWTPQQCPLCAEGGTPVKPGGARHKEAGA